MVLKTTELNHQVRGRLQTTHESAEELCRETLIRSRVPSWVHGSPEDVTLERCHPIQEDGKVGPQVYQSFQGFDPGRQGCLLLGSTR